MHSSLSKLLIGAWMGFGAIASLCAQPSALQTSDDFRRVVISSIKPAIQTNFVVGYGLTWDDFARIEMLEGIKRATPVRELRHEVRAGERAVDALVLGTSPSCAKLHSFALERGRFLTDKDIKQLNNIAVLNDRAARVLFGGQDPIGQNVRIGQGYYLVVGVAASEREPRDGDPPRRMAVSQVYVPLSTMRSRMGDLTFVREAGRQSGERYELSRIELEVPSLQADEMTRTLQLQLSRSHPAESFRVEIPTPAARPESSPAAPSEGKP